MIALGIVLFVLGLSLFLIAWRGRVVARGQFCRKCKFDLAGLDIDSSAAKCPECGCEIHQESARRKLLRRRSRLGLAAAALLLIGSITTLGVWSSGNASVILGVMPDSIVLQLTDIGMDAALDELVIRVSRVPNPMTSDQLDHAIESGLKHQADLLVRFDPRWGEILLLMCVDDKMADEQLKQYMFNGLSVDVLIRDRVHQGSDKIDALMKVMPSRFQSLTGGYTGHIVERKRLADGIVGEPWEAREVLNSFGVLIHVPAGGWGSSSGPVPIVPSGDALDGKIGEQVLAFTEFELVLSPASGQFPPALNMPVQNREDKLVVGRYIFEHEVEIIDPDEPIVPEVHDPELALLAAEALGILPIKILADIPEMDPKQRESVLSMSTQAVNLPEDIALRAYIRLDDGEEIRFGQWVSQIHIGYMGSGIQWSIGDQERDSVIEFTQRMIEQGHVDVIFRTDAKLVEYQPQVKQVIDLTIIFEDVPVESAESVSGMSSSSGDTWIKGKIFKEEPNASDPVQSPSP